MKKCEINFHPQNHSHGFCYLNTLIYLNHVLFKFNESERKSFITYQKRIKEDMHYRAQNRWGNSMNAIWDAAKHQRKGIDI